MVSKTQSAQSNKLPEASRMGTCFPNRTTPHVKTDQCIDWTPEASPNIIVGVCREDNPRDVDEAYGEGTYARLFPPVTRCFTFGSGHPQGLGAYVRITAATAAECREEMVQRYANKWAFEYSEEQIAEQAKKFHMYEVDGDL